MKKTIKNISQILTGAGAAICLWTGKAMSVYAEEAPKTEEQPTQPIVSQTEGGQLPTVNDAITQ